MCQPGLDGSLAVLLLHSSQLLLCCILLLLQVLNCALIPLPIVQVKDATCMHTHTQFNITCIELIMVDEVYRVLSCISTCNKGAELSCDNH